jgi:hypothetical protein
VISPAAISVLIRLEEGETLFRTAERTFFHLRVGGNVPQLLAKVMVAEGLIEPGPDLGVLHTFRLTERGRKCEKIMPLGKYPIPTLQWFKRIREKVRGLGDHPLHDLVVVPGCLIWTGPVDTKGYPKTTCAGKTVGLIRFLYEYTFGPLPTGARMKNTECHHKRCINPHHWEDSTKIKFEAMESARPTLARVRRALIMGNDELALSIIRSIHGTEPEPEPEPEQEPAAPTKWDPDDLMDHLEHLWKQYNPSNLAALLVLADGVCSEAEARHAIRQIGGTIARQLLSQES